MTWIFKLTHSYQKQFCTHRSFKTNEIIKLPKVCKSVSQLIQNILMVFLDVETHTKFKLNHKQIQLARAKVDF